MTSLKQPPVFNPDGGDNYADWKNDLEVWCMLTDGKINQGPAVYLSLQGDARDAVRPIPKEDLKGDDAIQKILAELDKVYLKDQTTRAFNAIKAFVHYKRESVQPFAKFLVEFNNKYREVKKHNLNFDDGILAFFLLMAANLTDDHERLVRATAQLSFDDMKDKLQKVFGEFDGNDDSKLPVKDVKEECLYARNDYSRGRGPPQRGYAGARYSRNYRGRGAGGRGGFSQGADRQKGNPGDMRCYECDSTMHLIKDCPHRQERDTHRQSRDKTEHAHVTMQFALITGMESKEQDAMLFEGLARAIVDSGCTKTVAGATWVEEYLALLSPEERDIVEKTARKSTTRYRFGDGKETVSVKEITLPMFICGKKVEVKVEVVENTLPLLLGRPSMTKLGMILDTRNHSVTVDGRNFKLGLSSNGHYLLPVSAFTYEGTKFVFFMDRLPTYTTEEKKKKALKLHRQFAHSSKERLLKLLRDGGCKDKEFMKAVEDVCTNCTFCQKYRHAKPRPVVGLPKGDRFNQVVSMDLKEVVKGKVWILHLVDNCTRYTAAALISTKKKEVVVKKIFQIWLAYFGSPVKLHNDCGGEFENEVLKEMAQAFGVEISTTPGEAPFSNGVVERGNTMLYETMKKTQEDARCSLETALAWAVCAKNSLQNVFGYSPNQLVLGRSVNLPSVAQDKLPALEKPELIQSDLVRENLNALHKARENFIKSEASERIRRALRHNVRTYAEEIFNPGEKVYFRCRNDKWWRGPAKVLGKESNFVLIRQGASYFRCHPCNLIKVNPGDDHLMAKENKNEKSEADEIMAKENKNEKSEADVISQNEDDTEEECVSENEPEEEEYLEDVQNAEDEVRNNPENEEDEHNAEEDENNAEDEVQNDTDKEEGREQEELSAEDSNNSDDQDEQIELLQNSKKKPRPKTTVQYKLEDGTTEKANVLSTQPKQSANAKWKGWVNVKIIGKEEPVAVDWSKVEWWREVGNTEQVLTLTAIQEYDAEVIEAKEKEINNLKEHDVFEVVEDRGQKTVSCRWVFKEKQNPDGSTWLKGRLVARGFEERLLDKKVDSPTCSRQSLRLALITATSMNWELQVLDITSAFLQGNKLERTIFIRPPAEVCEKGKIWRLKRCLYGLADAPREWYDRVASEMKRMGGKVSLFDKSVFLWHEDHRLVGMIVTHVDDFEYCGTLQWQRKVIGELVKTFKISKTEKGSFKYVGLNVEQNGKLITIDQSDYCKNLREIKLSHERKKQIDEPLTQEEKRQLRSVCGQVLWATSQTRPDSAFEGCQISNYGHEATVKAIIEANKTIRKLKSEQLRIMYPSLGDPAQMKVVVYGDGSHASLPSGASQGGNIVFLVGENGKAAPVSWKSKRLDRVTKSPLATEVSAVADAADYGHLVASMSKELFALGQLPEIELYTDSFSLKEHLESKRVICDPRLRVDIARLKEMSDLREVSMRWVPGKWQLADCLTKRGASSELLRKVLATGVLPEHQHSQM